MASLRKKPNSKYFIACFTDHNGRQCQRSTRSMERSKAMHIALQFERVYREMMTETQVRRVMADISKAINGRSFLSVQVGHYLENWLASRTSISDGTRTRYKDAITRFKAFLGDDRCSQDMHRLSVEDFAGFRDGMAKVLAPGTANLYLKVLSSIMESAANSGYALENPVRKTERLRPDRDDATRRRRFSLDEVRRLLDNAEPEWKGIILMGLYTGQRLGDIVRLRWCNVDLEKEQIRLKTRKTNRDMLIPLAKPLHNYLLTLPSSDSDAAPVFPRAFGVVQKEHRVNNLSNEFYELMVKVGLASPRSAAKQREGEGRAAKRQQRALVFHSLRHTCTSLLANAGVARAVTMDLIGHDSAAAHAGYTEVDEDSKRRAFGQLPDIMATPAKKPAGKGRRK